MPSVGKRRLGRNVFFYDDRNRDEELGGLVLNLGVTKQNFYAMIEIVLRISGPYSLQDANGQNVPRNDDALNPGKYFIVTNSTITVNDEQVYTRLTSSKSTGSRLVQAFRKSVRERDRGCVVTKQVVLGADEDDWIEDDWIGYEAAHIFPLAFEEHWISGGFDQFVTIMPSTGGGIDSVQNGLLLRKDMHSYFDNYAFSINPDDDYKFICFRRDNGHIAGEKLDARLLDDERCPPKELLRWHFRQAVLTNMRGEGEPTFEHDFPPGSDILEDIRNGPKAAERMEFELFDRLAHHIDREQGEGGSHTS